MIRTIIIIIIIIIIQIINEPMAVKNKTEYTDQDPSSQKLCDSKKILGRTFTKQNLESKEVSRTAGRDRARLQSQAETHRPANWLDGKRRSGGRKIWYKEKRNGNTEGRVSGKVPGVTLGYARRTPGVTEYR
jgi:hypothetical protein